MMDSINTEASTLLTTLMNGTPFEMMGDGTSDPPPETAVADAAADWLLTLTLVVKTCLMGLIIAASIFGNLLVIISVARFRKLRIITNYFVVSLAMADILVALVAMGFNASVIIFGRWMFGAAMCDIWNSFDVYCCTVSILHLCCISVDRYYAISQPLMYPMKITRKKVSIMLANIWTWPVLISYLPIFLGWYTTEEHQVYRIDNPDRCVFVVNKTYAVISSSISFWIPAAIMLFTYYRIYGMASHQEKMLLKNADAAMIFRQQNQRRSEEMEQHQANHIQHTSQDIGSNAALASHHGNSGICRPLIPPTIQVTKPDVLPEVSLNGTMSKALTAETSLQLISQAADPHPPPSITPPKRPSAGDRSALLPDEGAAGGSVGNNNSSKDRHLQKIRREHKAARTLGIIMGAFVLCWLPFFIWYLSVTLCGEACYCPDIVVEVLFWIGYFNSTLNPLIYAYFNKDFREAFRNTLTLVFCCRDPRRNQQQLIFHQQNPQRTELQLQQQVRQIRHSSGDTIAGIERIDHKRQGGQPVQHL